MFSCRLARAVRSHWSIENQLHWVLDVSYREDDNRSRKDHTAENLAWVWSTRREIIRALVKQIEVSDEQVRIVYRVNTDPFAEAPNGGIAQDCRRGRESLFFRGFPPSLVFLRVAASIPGSLCRVREHRPFNPRKFQGET
jgi:hypothetical protein